MRLIDADKLKENLQDAYEEYDGYDPHDLLRFAERVDTEIDNAPTVPLPDFKEGYKQAILDGKTNFSRPQGNKVFDRENFKKFVQSRMDMQDLYLPIHFFDLLDEYCGVDERKGGEENGKV